MSCGLGKSGVGVGAINRYTNLMNPYCSGLTELIKVNSLCMAHDIPLVPHGSGPYSYHVRTLIYYTTLSQSLLTNTLTLGHHELPQQRILRIHCQQPRWRFDPPLFRRLVLGRTVACRWENQARRKQVWVWHDIEPRGQVGPLFGVFQCEPFESV